MKKKKKTVKKITKKLHSQKNKWILLGLLILLCVILLTVTTLQYSQKLQQYAASFIITPTPTYSQYAPLNENGFIDYPPNNIPPAIIHSQATNGTMKTVTYCNGEQMDIYTPNNPGTCMPIAMYVHGGGWSAGGRAQLQPVETPNTLDALLGQQFVIVSIDYHLGSPPSSVYPQNIDDVTCAVRYLRSNAVQLHIDPNHIGLWGDSAGGHLVALAGLADQTGGFDTGSFAGTSSKVQAVVDLFGPTTMGTSVFGTSKANPITWISTTAHTDPPFLILQGTADSTVPPSDSQDLYNALIAAQQPATLQMVQGAGHEFTPPGTPNDAQLSTIMENFFVTNLKTNNTCTSTPQPTISPPITPGFNCLGGNCSSPTVQPTIVPSNLPSVNQQPNLTISASPTVSGIPSLTVPSGKPHTQPTNSNLQSLLIQLLQLIIGLIQLLLGQHH